MDASMDGWTDERIYACMHIRTYVRLYVRMHVRIMLKCQKYILKIIWK
jgi:hypothetical protein